MQRLARMKRELQMLSESPPHGVACWPKESTVYSLEAQIVGGEGTSYEGGIFKLDIVVPERYPFEPPKVKFVTPIYHPNVDTAGRICLDILKMPPKGAWKPCLNLTTVLTSIQVLMAEPNPEDPLMNEIANEFQYDKVQFSVHAKEHTKKHAMQCSSMLSVFELQESQGHENASSSRRTENKDKSKPDGKKVWPLTDITQKNSKVQRY